jgi:hypothetical protein
MSNTLLAANMQFLVMLSGEVKENILNYGVLLISKCLHLFLH